MSAGGQASMEDVERSVRVHAIDELRGLVVLLMILDHVRDFFHRTAVTADPLDLSSGDPALFLTRWITHLCAPTFVFLAGVSASLRKDSSVAGTASQSRFLLTRGLWLILLEAMVIGLGFNLGPWLFFQVIWAIGIGFVALSGLIFAPRWVSVTLGAVLVVLHPLLMLVPPDAFGVLRPFTTFGPVPGAIPTLVAYPALPWMGVMLLGYGFGPTFRREREIRKRRLITTAVLLLSLFALVRLPNVYGTDFRGWSVQPEPLWTALSFVNVSKYPPSLAYLSLMGAIGLALFVLMDSRTGKSPTGLDRFGRVPFFVYLLHVWVAHLLAVAVGVLGGVPASAFLNSIVDPSRLVSAGWGFGLPAVYGFWLLVVAALWLPARRYDEFRRRSRRWWTSYL